MDQKYEETDSKFEKTNQHKEILKVFEKQKLIKYEETDLKLEKTISKLQFLRL